MLKKSIYPIGSLLLLLLLFVAVSMVSERGLQGMRFDLTQNRLFTLSEGSKNVLAGLREPVTLRFYFSQEASREFPQVRSYARRVDELLDEFVSHGGGKVIVKRIDPAPFSEEEDEAAAYGLQAAPINNSGDKLYLGIVGTNSLDDVQVLPFLQPSKEKFLEYDLAKIIYTLGNPEKKTIGLLSTLPMSAGFDPATQSMRPSWVVYDQLSQLFEIKAVDPSADELPSDIDLLMLVHPRGLSDAMLYRIEQYVLRGGHLVAFLDPYAESDRGNPNDPMSQMQPGSASSLGTLTGGWGVRYDPARVVGDLQYGVGTGAMRHIGILSVPKEAMSASDIVSADLELVNFSSTGWLEPAEDATTRFEPLVSSSENAAPLDASRLRFLANPSDLLDGFNPTGKRYALAARVSGPARATMEPPEGFTGERLTESGEEGINILLFADTDVLTDRMWVQKQPFLGRELVSSFADNGNLAINAVDNMLGNSDLISIRTRATSARPFGRVEELRVAAEKTYHDTEARLQQELQETENKLSQLQAAKGQDEMTVISPEEQAEIQRFMDQRLQIRRDLRQVQHDLKRDIDRLDTRLKLINIVAVPVLVLVAGLLWSLRRRRREVSKAAGEARP